MRVYSHDTRVSISDKTDFIREERVQRQDGQSRGDVQDVSNQLITTEKDTHVSQRESPDLDKTVIADAS